MYSSSIYMIVFVTSVLLIVLVIGAVSDMMIGLIVVFKMSGMRELLVKK